DYTDADWLRMAHATYVEQADGLRPDYDPQLGLAFATASGAGPDLWPVFDVCARTPTLLIPGAHSDILSRETGDEMVRRYGVTLAEIENRGHAPDLSEPDAVRAIRTFLARAPRG